MRKRILFAALLACLVSFSMHAAAGPFWTDSDRDAKKKPQKVETLPAFSELAHDLSPAVVFIRVELSMKASVGELYHKLFGDKQPGLGTGFVISPDGYIVTNSHVIEDAEEVIVRFKDHAEYKAAIVGMDDKTDIALLKVDGAPNLPILTLGNSDSLQVGEWVMAIGNPLGFDYSVTVGVVSAKERRSINPGHVKDFYGNFVQTDAAINRGNSGGPLINVYGEVVAINSAIASPAQGMGIGFAIPINMAKSILPQLKEHGKVTRSMLGARVDAMTPDEREKFNFKKSDQGVIVREIFEGGPADKGGLKTMDIVLSFDGKRIKDSDQMRWLVSIAGVDRKVKMKIMRGGKTRNLQVKLGELKEVPESMQIEFTEIEEKESPKTVRRANTLGLVLSRLSDSKREELKIKESEGGLYVAKVAKGSVAYNNGLRDGDVILKVNDKTVEKPAQFEKIIEELPQNGLIRLYLKRDGANLFTAFRK